MNWQALLIDGKNRYDEKNWLEAEFYTQQAERLLNEVIAANGIEQSTLLAWVCANHNLSAIHEQQGDTRIAFQYLIKPHRKMLFLSQKSQTPELMLLTLNALNITLKRITQFKRKHALCEDCYKAMADHTTLEEHMHKFQHSSPNVMH